ncbi:hypothetical protein RsTz2092_07800 [Deferribacterales bacterium RsTz2092]|nr:hypothetical protein AGMMS49941_05250 [Deferribacterales bacterium]
MSNLRSLRSYETVFILSPELGADAQTEGIDFYKDSIVKNGGEVVNVELWGKRALAYKIDGFSEGIYTVIQFNAPTEYVKELEKRYKFNENVMRFVIVQLDEKKFKANPRKDPVKRERRTQRFDGDSSADAASTNAGDFAFVGADGAVGAVTAEPDASVADEG